VLLPAPSPISPRHDTAPTSGLRGSQTETGGKGRESISHAVHRRLVLPAAMAGVRWRSRCGRRLPPRSRGCARATRNEACRRDIRDRRRGHHCRWASSCGAGFDVAQVRRARAAMPWRMVRLTRSMKAVFNRPERPNPCRAALRASSVPASHHMRNTNQLAPPIVFLHLAVDQASRHLPTFAHCARDGRRRATDQSER
jgi:hypothetical protein